jgi:hypothetical protein
MRSNSNCGCHSVYSWLNSHHSINFNVWHAWASTPLLHKTCKNLWLSFPNYLFFTSFITHHHHYTHITMGVFSFLCFHLLLSLSFKLYWYSWCFLPHETSFLGDLPKGFFWQWANQNGLLKINKNREASPHWINRTMNKYPTYIWNICMIITWNFCL